MTIAIADAFSDALGIHISEETENVHTPAQIWTATFATFFAKLFFALLFIIPVLLLSLQTAVLASIAWGLSILGLLSYRMAKEQNEKPHKVIAEHLLIAITVIVLTNFIGKWISAIFV